jgi:hypothetical protein
MTNSSTAPDAVREKLNRGVVIPACPLALNAQRKLDERRQRALLRYYLAAGAGGIAMGVHTTQFAIRNPKVGLFGPVLELAAAEILRGREGQNGCVAVAGICGRTAPAVAEAEMIRALGFHFGLLNLGALEGATENELIAHCRTVAEIIPVFGFYLQPSAGGRVLPHSFWRRFAEIENIVAIKIAPFNRYQTVEVMRAVAESGREDIALYTGNDDNIVMDLVTPYRFMVNGKEVERRIVGGLLGHWAVWTRRAVAIHEECRRLAGGDAIPADLIRRSVAATDCNAAFFDAANGYAGCIAGLHEVLRRQGLLEGIWCLDPKEGLGAGQREEIDRVYRAYPELNDDEFVAQHRDEWLRG